MSDSYGMEVLEKALKDAAVTRTAPDQFERYLANRPDYSDVVRATTLDGLDCWYGFIYTKNNSAHKLRESITLDMKGLEIAHIDENAY